MMDELDILKKDWKKKENSFNQITEEEIYAMLHRKSSSVVKWILIISVIEIVFWIVIGLFSVDENHLKTLEMYHLKTVMPIIYTINYGVVLYFIYLFYRNYKTINTTDTIKQLMQSILKTRKTVQQYVWYNIIMSFLSIILLFTCQIKYDPNLDNMIKNSAENITPNTFYFFLFLAYIIAGLVIAGLIWLFYRLIYGILLKRLNNNYKELEKLDL